MCVAKLTVCTEHTICQLLLVRNSAAVLDMTGANYKFTGRDCPTLLCRSSSKNINFEKANLSSGVSWFLKGWSDKELFVQFVLKF